MLVALPAWISPRRSSNSNVTSTSGHSLHQPHVPLFMPTCWQLQSWQINTALPTFSRDSTHIGDSIPRSISHGSLTYSPLMATICEIKLPTKHAAQHTSPKIPKFFNPTISLLSTCSATVPDQSQVKWIFDFQIKPISVGQDRTQSPHFQVHCFLLCKERSLQEHDSS